MAGEMQTCNRCLLSRPKEVFGRRRLHCNRCQNLLKRYKTTYQEIKALFDEQGGLCALCETPLKFDNTVKNQSDAANVDHCHTTNDIRGLLCRNCNLLLGYAKDRVVVLQAAIRYLRKSAEQE